MGSSTQSETGRGEPISWRAAGLLYYELNFFCQNKFGGKTWKLSLDAGCDCPNRDGTLATSGCVFCDIPSFSPSRRAPWRPLDVQLREGVQRLQDRHRAERFLAYFQPATNTYGPLGQLRCLFGQAADWPGVVGLIVGTRPDCVGDEVLDMLAELAERTWLLVELGVQTIHNRTLDRLNRRHHFEAFCDACTRATARGLGIGAHLILGLPGESDEDMLATARELARWNLHSIKLHNLYAVRGTELAEMVKLGEAKLPSLEEHVRRVADFLEETPPECVVDRVSGDAPAEYLVGPDWCRQTSAICSAVKAEFLRRGTCQGWKVLARRP